MFSTIEYGTTVPRARCDRSWEQRSCATVPAAIIGNSPADTDNRFGNAFAGLKLLPMLAGSVQTWSIVESSLLNYLSFLLSANRWNGFEATRIRRQGLSFLFVYS